jgi:hypothetical protein
MRCKGKVSKKGAKILGFQMQCKYVKAEESKYLKYIE